MIFERSLRRFYEGCVRFWHFRDSALGGGSFTRMLDHTIPSPEVAMKMKQGTLFILALVVGCLALSAADCWAYLEQILAAGRAPRLDVVMEVGAMPSPLPSRRQIIDQMEGNLCRCGAHKRIIEAIQAAANEMGGVQR